jgi:hypothetical protein
MFAIEREGGPKGGRVNCVPWMLVSSYNAYLLCPSSESRRRALPKLNRSKKFRLSLVTCDASHNCHQRKLRQLGGLSDVVMTMSAFSITALTRTTRRSPNYVSPMSRRIPIELCALIFQHITSRAELSNLCAVSRTFRDEAQRILYHTVHLPNDYDLLVSWCRTIVETPRLALAVYSLFLPATFTPATFEHGRLPKAEFGPKVRELQQVVKRALSSLSRLVELHTFSPVGTAYLNVKLLCGHPFRLLVFEEELPRRSLGHWLKFLSGQPGIRYWRPNILRGRRSIDPDILPSLTSAQVYSCSLNVLTRCPMLRALQVMRWSLQYFDELSDLKAFRCTLTTLSLEYSDMVELEIVRDAVPNIKFLALRPQSGVSSLVQFLSKFY